MTAGAFGARRGPALGPRLELRQGQTLVLTPQLMQAIKLLQLSNLDLVAYVEQELERNPILERAGEVDGDEPGPPEPAEDWGGDLVAAADADVTAVGGTVDADPEAVYGEAPDTTGEQPVSGLSAGPTVGGGRSGDSLEDFDLEAVLSRAASLRDHLEAQLSIAGLAPAERLIAAHLIDLVDEAGYLTDPPAEIAERLGVVEAEVGAALAVVQGFDPPGVFARSLAECLALQLRDRDRFDPAMAALLDNLHLLARRDFPALRDLCGVDDEDLAEMVAEIRALDPKPGLRFSAEPVQPVVPDVFVRPRADGGWAIELNADTLPRVLVNQTYFARVSSTLRGDKDKSYLIDRLQEANWLVRSLDQRARTILKVATEIVRQQDSFLAYGVRHLKPLNLRTVADAIEMHESTVSRVTSNKFMATPRGVFELKYFFSNAIAATGGGEAHSSEAVRDRIRELVRNEGPDEVLSDDQIVQKLRGEGVEIARRTVAKYREALGIASSVQRRRERQLAI